MTPAPEAGGRVPARRARGHREPVDTERRAAYVYSCVSNWLGGLRGVRGLS